MSTIVLNLTNSATTDNLETAGFTAAQASDLEGDDGPLAALARYVARRSS